jgi:PAS domain S-box-containing protein
MKILIVDDREENLYLLEALLKGSGYEVVSALNGKESLVKLHSEKIDMIISDILMPVMDGFTLCKECKVDEKLKSIPFIFYTATYKDERDEELALKLGADKYLIKPMEPEKLIEAIRGLFQDMNAGKTSVKSSILQEEREIYKLYNERLIKKLEKKMLELEAEVAQRKLYGEKLERLNRLLHAIRNVNQIIVRQNDRQGLIQAVCDNFTKIGGYYNAWIALFDDSGKVFAAAEAGMGEEVLPLIRRFGRDDSIVCIRQAMNRQGAVVIKNPGSVCGDCQLREKDSNGDIIAIRFEHNNKVYGLLVASIPTNIIENEEENALLEEIAGDIAFALAGIETRELKEQAEKSLIQSEEKCRTIFNATVDGIILADSQSGKFATGNTAISRMLGYTEKELATIGVEDIHPKEELPQIIEKFKAQSRGEISLSMDIPVKRKDGSIFYADINSAPVTFGGKTYLMGVFRDITERRQMQEKLLITERLSSVGELASGIAHEINNPLTGIIGFSQILLEKDLPEDIKKDLRLVYNEAQRAANVIKNLLTFARKHQLTKQLIDVHEVMNKVLELRAYEEKVNNIEVIQHLSPGLPLITADYYQLQQVFFNIIINAEYFMMKAHNKGVLTITTESLDSSIRISFANDGQAILKENLCHIFDPFFTTKKEGDGTGLGLSICHGIITNHGGHIYAESEPEGITTFTIEMPIRQDNTDNIEQGIEGGNTPVN